MLDRLTFFESHVAELARLKGVDTSGLAMTSVLARTQPDAEVEALARVVRDLRQVLNDELMGMTTRPIPAGSFDIVTRSALRRRTLGHFLHDLIAAAELMYSPPDLRCRIETGAAAAAITYENAHQGDDEFYYLYALLVTHRGASWLIDERLRLQRVELKSGRSGILEDLRHIFQCDVWLGQPRNGLVFDPHYLAATITRTPEDLDAYLARRPLDVLYWPGADRSLAARVADILRRELRARGAMPDAAALAADMRLPPHGLRRALGREGATIQALKDRARFEMACEQLANGRLPIDRVAESLGFDEPNSFRRAFKRWSGVSPQAFRKQRDSRASPPPAPPPHRSRQRMRAGKPRRNPGPASSSDPPAR